MRVHGLTSKVYVFEFMLEIYLITGVRLGTSVKEKEGTWLWLILN